MKIATSIPINVPAATAQGPGIASVPVCPGAQYQPTYRAFFRWPAPAGQMQDESQARAMGIGVPTGTLPGGGTADGRCYAFVSNSSNQAITGYVDVQDLGA